MLNIGFLSYYPFLKTLFPSFLPHHCLQFTYPANFLVRECFSLHVSSIFFIIIFYRLLIWQVPNPPPLPPPPPPPPPHSITVTSRRPHLFGITVRNAGEFKLVVSLFSYSLLFAQFSMYVNVAMGTLLYALRNDYVYQYYSFFIYMIPEDVLPEDSKAIGIIFALKNHSYPELYSREKN